MVPAREPDPAPVDKSRETAKNEVPEFFTVNSGRRFYSPELGRWLSRDPIEEAGGFNLCSFVRNRPIGRSDYLGLAITDGECDAAVDKAKKSNKKVKELIRALEGAPKERNCKVPSITCRCCTSPPDPRGGGWFGLRKEGIILCSNRAQAQVSVYETLVHELTHALDDCYGTDWGDCYQRACSEVRAIDYSGNCALGGKFYEESQRYDDCVKKYAAIATSAMKKCGDGKIHVKKVFQQCMGNKPPNPIELPPKEIIIPIIILVERE